METDNKEIFINTELLLLKSICDIVKIKNNYYYKSNKFPFYNGGNGIVVCF